MCGIAGIISLKGNKHLSKQILQMNNAIKHRGPDDEGYFLLDVNSNLKISAIGDDSNLNASLPGSSTHIKDTLNNKSSVAFSHRRLSIIDLSHHGHQPLQSSCGKYCLVYNGEIYNYKEIRRELTHKGYKFKSNTDTEVLIFSYLEWGVNCVDRFNGMFAFAIYDLEESKLLLFRDRIGIKPLYFYKDNEYLIFSSEIKAIIASGLVNITPDYEGLWHNLSFGVAPRPQTSFKNICALEQGSYAILDIHKSTFVKEKYWELETGRQNKTISLETAQKQLEEHLHKAIKYRLISDVTVSSFMSGGVDSTLITSIANKINPGISAFTLGFKTHSSDFDELLQAKETCRLNNINHIVKIVDPSNIIKDLDKIVELYEEPFYSLAPNYVISKLAKKSGVKVVLSGLGGDELLGGYNHFDHLKYWKMSRPFRFALKPLSEAVNMHKINKRVNDLFTSKNINLFYKSYYSVFNEDEKRLIYSNSNNYNSDTVLDKYFQKDRKFNNDMERLSYLGVMSYIGNHHVYRMDKFTMNFGLESRFPMLDHNLVEFCFSIPSSFKIVNNKRKYLLRKIAKKHVPSSVLNMKKKGFRFPMDLWVKNELKDLCNDSISRLSNRDFVNKKTIHKLISELSPTQVWHLTMLELWFEKFID